MSSAKRGEAISRLMEIIAANPAKEISVSLLI
jgi:hypothetical protein